MEKHQPRHILNKSMPEQIEIMYKLRCFISNHGIWARLSHYVLQKHTDLQY